MIGAAEHEPLQGGEPMTTSTTKRRTALIAALVVVLLAVAGTLAWRGFTQSPRYSVGQLANAVDDKDWDGFVTYVDVDAVLDQAYDQLAEESLPSEGSLFGGIAGSLAESVKPTVLVQAKSALRRAVESGVIPAGDGPTPFRQLFMITNVKSVTHRDTDALVIVEVPLSKTRSVDLELRMTKIDEFWRVTAIENIAELDLVGRQ